MTEVLATGDETSLFAQYRPVAGCHDELLDAEGGVRPHAARLIDALGHPGRERFARGAKLADRLVRENGIAYGPPDAEHRPWQLDPLPLLLGGRDWDQLVAGLVQRWRLLNAILHDVYGRRTLVRDGLPAEVVYRDPQFLRSCVGIEPPDGTHLHLYAADVVRGVDGRWWVVADRTNAPSGLGFALENRIVSARAFPELLERCHVQRHAPFFIALKAMLAGLSPRETTDPRVVLLTDDTATANFFEDSFLARYLGFVLARFDDLTVRDERVFLKTLEGLLPVDVLLRRPSGNDCDPLEMEAATAARGVPGLVQAVRSGNVGIANGLGCGILESPVWMPFLRGLCRDLLGQELKLPSVATWWCGQEDERRHVLEGLDRLSILPAHRHRGQDADELRSLRGLSSVERRELVVRDPVGYCGQEIVTRSSMPTWSNGVVEPARVALRVFLCAGPDGEPAVLPGGLTRVSRQNVPLFVSLHRGERSKDTWVVRDAPVERVSLLPTSDPAMVVSRHVEPIPSRVAENFFWLGRNLARVEIALRSLRTTVVRLTEDGYGDPRRETGMLLRLLAEQGQLEPGYAIAELRERLPALSEHLVAFALDTKESGSLRSMLSAAVFSASAVRDRIAIDGWRILRQADLRFRRWGDAGLPELADQLDSLLVNLLAFGGLVAEAMTRNASRLLLDVGLRLERSLQHAVLLGTFLEEPQPTSDHLDALLEIADARMTYRQRFLGPPRTGPVLELLVTAADNPRSSRSQLERLRTAAASLPDEVDPGRVALVRRSIDRLLEVLSELGEERIGPEDVDRFQADLRETLERVAVELEHAYFAHVVPIYQPLDVRST